MFRLSDADPDARSPSPIIRFHLAIAAAEREGPRIGEWLTRAIRTQVQADHRSDRLPIALDPPFPSKVDRQADLADLERLVERAQKLAAANKEPIPAGITRATSALMREHLRAIKVYFC